MNPFLDKVFEEPKFQSSELNKTREKFLQDKDFDVNDLVDWFVYMEPRLPTPNDIITQLYYVYRTKIITNKIGMSKPHTAADVGGFLVEEFYTKLYKQLSTDTQAEIFPFMPGNTQTDEMLLNYLKNTPKSGSGSVRNYHGEKLKTSTLEWLIDNRIGSVRDWKPDWWTPKLKTKAIKKEPFVIAYIPESLLTKAEVRNYLKEAGDTIKSNIHQFYKALPETFQMDPDILALTINMTDGLSSIKNLRSDGSSILGKMTEEHYLKYFKYFNTSHNGTRNRYGVWRLIPEKFRTPKVLEAALGIRQVATEVFLDDETELSNSQIETFLNSFIASPADRARIALKLKKMGKLDKETLEQVSPEFNGIDYLSKKESSELMDSDMVDYLLDKDDPDFLSKKTNWPKNVEVTNRQMAKMSYTLSWAKLKSRVFRRFTEDDYVEMFYIVRELSGKMYGEPYDGLDKLVDNGYIDVSEETIKMINSMGKDGSYEGWKAAKDMFLF